MEDTTCNTGNVPSENISDKEFMLHFISIYRNIPFLWDIKQKNDMAVLKRRRVIQYMTNKLRVYRPKITEKEVKKEIDILRMNFKRENIKVKKSMLSGLDDVYVPSLWYYKECEFLQDQVEEECGISTIIEQHESLSQSLSQISTSKQTFLQPSTTNTLQINKEKKENLQHELMTLDKDHFEKIDNEYQVMTGYWAFKFHQMSVGQRRLAEKFINDILFEGVEGNLHRYSVVINPSHSSIISQAPSLN